MPTIPQHNYLTKMLAMVEAGALPLDVGVHQLTVWHDAWCGIYQGACCNCDPDIELAWSLPAISEN